MDFFQALPDQSLILQYKSILEEKDTQIANLLSTNENLTEELEKIKKRYKQFRELLEQVECRQKAEIVGENMKLKKVQGEMFQEVHTLRQENEQLKTKLATMEKVRFFFVFSIFSRFHQIFIFIFCRKRGNKMFTNPLELNDYLSEIFYHQNSGQIVWKEQTMLAFLSRSPRFSGPCFLENFYGVSEERNSFVSCTGIERILNEISMICRTLVLKGCCCHHLGRIQNLYDFRDYH